MSPSRQEHECQAQDNEQFSSILESEHSEYPDWIVTTKFYAALHYIDAILDTENVDPKKHGERFQAIEKSRNISPRAKSLYETLWDLSYQARYKCVTIHQGQVNSASMALSNLKSELGI